MKRINPSDFMGIEDYIQAHREFISKTPYLLSILYDVDLLPEQVYNNSINALRMGAIVDSYLEGYKAGYSRVTRPVIQKPKKP